MRLRIIIPLLSGLLLAGLQWVFTMRKSDENAVAEFKKNGLVLRPHLLHIGSRSLHYVAIGADSLATIVFIHGSPGSWDAFNNYLQDSSLRSRFRLLSIDRPGFGFSDFGKALNLPDECLVIESFLDSIRNGKALYLVGHSLGGSIVPVLAADRPALVSAVVIIAGALDPGSEPEENWRAYFIHIPLRWLLPGAMRPSNDELYFFKRDVLNLAPKLKKLRCPVYIVHAKDDALVDYSNVAYMEQIFTTVPVSKTIFTSGNHFLPWNHSREITDLLCRLK